MKDERKKGWSGCVLWLWRRPSQPTPIHVFQWWDVCLPLRSSQWIPCFCFASQNHRMVEIVKDLWRSFFLIPLSARPTTASCTWPCPCISWRSLQSETSTTSLGACASALSIAQKKQMFSDIQAEPLVLQSVPIASCFALLSHVAFSFLTELSLSWPTIRFSILFLALVLLRRSEGEAMLADSQGQPTHHTWKQFPEKTTNFQTFQSLPKIWIEWTYLFSL